MTSVAVQDRKDDGLQRLVLSVIFYGCVTKITTLNGTMMAHLDLSVQNFGTHLDGLSVTHRSLCETDLRPVPCLVWECQLQLYGLVSRFSETGSAAFRTYWPRVEEVKE